jgi:hypothetical protein
MASEEVLLALENGLECGLECRREQWYPQSRRGAL